MRQLALAGALALMLAQPVLAQDGSVAPARPFSPYLAEDDPHRDLAAEVIAAERAFDAYTAEHGFTAGFMAYAAPDGLLFRPDPVNARDYLAGRPVNTDTALRWWPFRVGVSVSGDLAWDYGAWTYGDNLSHGFFITIWARQPDGSWRWVLDHGAGSHDSRFAVERAWVDAPGVAGPDAWAEVQAMEAALNAGLVEDGTSAWQDRVTGAAWFATASNGPALTADSWTAEWRARPAYTGFQPLGGGASEAGDLAYTYGHATWADGRGHYIRVWRREAQGPLGWRVVYDQLTPVETPEG